MVLKKGSGQGSYLNTNQKNSGEISGNISMSAHMHHWEIVAMDEEVGHFNGTTCRLWWKFVIVQHRRW